MSHDASVPPSDAGLIALQRLAGSYGHRINEVGGEMLALCDHGLIDDDPASAGRSLERIRALAVALGDVGRQMVALAAETNTGGTTDLAIVGRDLAKLIQAISPYGSDAVSVEVPNEPLVVQAPQPTVMQQALAFLLARVPLSTHGPFHVYAGLADGAGRLRLTVGEPSATTAGLDLGWPVEPRAVAHPHPPPVPTGSRWPRALVAEDNQALRELVALGLEPLFEEVIEVADGDEALLRLAALNGEVDLAIFDLRMPKRDGMEVLVEALRRWPHLRAIVASGAASEGVAQAARASGARAVINKPFRLSELRAVARGVLADAEW